MNPRDFDHNAIDERWRSGYRSLSYFDLGRIKERAEAAGDLDLVRKCEHGMARIVGGVINSLGYRTPTEPGAFDAN